jgi:NOL1/NOP2/sun family putative RNA methylase
MASLPSALQERLTELLGDEFEAYRSQLAAPPRECLRVNALKAPVREVVEGLGGQGVSLEAVSWCRSGFWFSGADLGKSVEHFQGLFYLQDAASLLPPEVLAPTDGDVVLDAAAAPGGKATHLAALMGNRGALAANEVNLHRCKALRFNLSRMGAVNAAVTTLDMTAMPATKQRFDRILLDAPCSCEGRIGEDSSVLAQWKPGRIRRCSAVQRQLLETCYHLLAPGGVLVYSTCTLAPEENEGAVDHILGRFRDADVEAVEAPWRHAEGVTDWRGAAYDSRVSRCIRLYPHHHGTQGFFMARLRKCL